MATVVYILLRMRKNGKNGTGILSEFLEHFTYEKIQSLKVTVHEKMHQSIRLPTLSLESPVFYTT